MIVDLVVMENGGVVVGWSNMYYGYFRNFIVFGIVVNMGDGWEIVCRVRLKFSEYYLNCRILLFIFKVKRFFI